MQHLGSVECGTSAARHVIQGLIRHSAQATAVQLEAALML